MGCLTQPPKSSGARKRPAETTGRAVNWLKRETPFLSEIRFKNDLPEVHLGAWLASLALLGTSPFPWRVEGVALQLRSQHPFRWDLLGA